VVSNSLRLRGYELEAISAPRTRARKFLELAPVAAVVFVAVTLFGYFFLSASKPDQMNNQEMPVMGEMSYSATIVTQAPIISGVSIPLDIQIVDQMGNRVNAFEINQFGKYKYFVYVAVVPRDLSSFHAEPVIVSPRELAAYNGIDVNNGGMSGMSMGTASVTPQPTSAQPAEPVEIKIRQLVKFPKDGQYVVFVSFQPKGGDKITLAVPVEVGSAQMQAVALASDAPFTQPNGDLMITMRPDGVIKAGQPTNIYFDMVDAQGNVISSDIGLMSGSRLILHVLNEELTTYLRSDVVDSSNLQFTANFPKPGKYKLWLEYYYANQTQQVAFVLDVK
jgi:hypothetical protein